MSEIDKYLEKCRIGLVAAYPDGVLKSHEDVKRQREIMREVYNKGVKDAQEAADYEIGSGEG